MTNRAAATQDERLRRPAGIRSLQLGEVKVSYVPDGAVALHPRAWLPLTTEQVWADHPEYLDGNGDLVAGIGGLLVEHGGRALLIDSGFGPGTLPAAPGNPYGAIHGGALLDSLAALGRAPEDIDAVAFTHLHIDHVGWAAHPVTDTGRPAFARTEYLVADPEWTHRELLEAHGTGPEIIAALAPRVRTVVDGEEVFPGVRVMLTPGHTPGHASYVVTAGGRRLIAFGDALHSPIQVDHPEWSAAPDHDAELSATVRHRLVAELAEPDTLGFGVHFADVPFGHVRHAADGPAWRPVDG